MHVNAAVSANLIISAACSGVRSSTATLLIFTSWSPGTSRPSAGPPAHTKRPCVVIFQGVPMGLHSHGHRGWWQTAARILLIYFHLTLMQNFHPFNPSETWIQSPSIHTPPCLYSHLCNLRPHWCLAAVVQFFFCLLFSVVRHSTTSNKTSSYCC